MMWLQSRDQNSFSIPVVFEKENLQQKCDNGGLNFFSFDIAYARFLRLSQHSLCLFTIQPAAADGLDSALLHPPWHS